MLLPYHYRVSSFSRGFGSSANWSCLRAARLPNSDQSPDCACFLGHRVLLASWHRARIFFLPIVLLRLFLFLTRQLSFTVSRSSCLLHYCSPLARVSPAINSRTRSSDLPSFFFFYFAVDWNFATIFKFSSSKRRTSFIHFLFPICQFHSC